MGGGGGGGGGVLTYNIQHVRLGGIFTLLLQVKGGRFLVPMHAKTAAAQVSYTRTRACTRHADTPRHVHQASLPFPPDCPCVWLSDFPLSAIGQCDGGSKTVNPPGNCLCDARAGFDGVCVCVCACACEVWLHCALCMPLKTLYAVGNVAAVRLRDGPFAWCFETCDRNKLITRVSTICFSFWVS